jgi:hypothetical protein
MNHKPIRIIKFFSVTLKRDEFEVPQSLTLDLLEAVINKLFSRRPSSILVNAPASLGVRPNASEVLVYRRSMKHKHKLIKHKLCLDLKIESGLLIDRFIIVDRPMQAQKKVVCVENIWCWLLCS